MYHHYRKDNIHLRTAVFQSYGEKCAYCGRQIQQRELHIDHILPVHFEQDDNEEFKAYHDELIQSGFLADSIENYLPSCPPCNVSKSNKVFSVSNLRFYHETAKGHVDDILDRISSLRQKRDRTFFAPANSIEIQDSANPNATSKEPIKGINLAHKQEYLQKEPIYGNPNHLLSDLFVHHAVLRTIGNDTVRFENMIDAYIQSCHSTEHKLFLLLGDYGVGKSSSLKMLASKYNDGSFVYISLKDVLIFSDNIRDGIIDYCQRKHKFYFDFALLQQEIVFLLDGFDELQRVRNGTSEEEMLFRQIAALTQYDYVKVILSSRSTAFISSPHLLNYPTIYINDFDNPQIETWIKKWKIVNQHEPVTISLSGLKERNLLQICRNKLILYMVARIYNDELLETRQYTKAYVYKCFFDWTIDGKFREDIEYTYDRYNGSEKYSRDAYRRILQDIALIISQYSTNELIEVGLLEEKMREFQRQEINSSIFDFSQHLFTRHFFSTQKTKSQIYVEFSHKSLREYIYAEKIYNHLLQISSGKTILDQMGEWYQFGRNQRLSKEVFEFLEDLLAELSSDDLLKIGKQMHMRSMILLVSNGYFKKYIDTISDHEKSILNISESYFRSLVLSVIAGIINHICYNLICKKNPEKIHEATLISCEVIYKICDYYMGMSKLYLGMYPTFLQFVKYIKVSEKEIANMQYLDMNLRSMEVIDGMLFRGIIQKSCIELVNWVNVDFSIMKFDNVKFNNGTIEQCTFESCMFNHVSFNNITFKDVLFDLIREGTVDFFDCIFEKTSVSHYLCGDNAKPIELEGKLTLSL